MTVNVTTRQFAFEFSYPRSPASRSCPPILYLPKGQPVVFRLRSLDVIHSFFVPNFSEKLDAVPGIVTTLRVTPDTLGTFPVECTELCGAGHSLMRSSVRVVTPAAFASWIKSQPINGTPPVGTPPATVTQAVPDYNAVPGAGSSSSSAPSTSSSSSGSSSGRPRARARPPARPSSPARRAAAAATRSRPPARPGRSGPTSMPGFGQIARTRRRRRSAARRSSNASRPRSPSPTPTCRAATARGSCLRTSPSA